MGIRGQRGNIALLLLILLLLGGIIGGAMFLFRTSEVDEKGRVARDARAAYDEAVASMERALADPRNIEESLGRNPNSFNCLYSGTADCKGKGGGFLMYELGAGQHPLSHLALDQGADSLGTACKGYPSAECPLRVETIWEPVCAGDRCEGTKSLRVKAKIMLAPTLGPEAPLMWTKEALFTPKLELSQGSICERGGGVWAGTECLTPNQIAERQLASAKKPGGQNLPTSAEPADPRAAEETPAPVQPQYECPNQVVVQARSYPVNFLAADRGQVSVPAMSCPLPGYADVFVFQCAQKTPASFPNEGQWIQVEAVMAPPCDQDGNPIQPGARF